MSDDDKPKRRVERGDNRFRGYRYVCVRCGLEKRVMLKGLEDVDRDEREDEIRRRIPEAERCLVGWAVFARFGLGSEETKGGLHCPGCTDIESSRFKNQDETEG